MRQRGILVRDRSADPGCDGCVRITFGTTRPDEYDCWRSWREVLAELRLGAEVKA